MSYRDELIALGAKSEEILIDIYRRYVEGLIDRETAVTIIADVLAAANSRAVALADVALAAQLMVDVQAPVATAGIVRPISDSDRLVKAVNTLLVVAEASDVPESIVARIARAEPYEASQRAFSTAVEKSGITKGWIRNLEKGGCQLCQWWWRDGRVWPKAHPMPTHKGCVCHPIPVVRDDIPHTGYTKKLAQQNMEEVSA